MADRDDLFLEEVDEDVFLVASGKEMPDYDAEDEAEVSQAVHKFVTDDPAPTSLQDPSAYQQAAPMPPSETEDITPLPAKRTAEKTPIDSYMDDEVLFTDDLDAYLDREEGITNEKALAKARKRQERKEKKEQKQPKERAAGLGLFGRQKKQPKPAETEETETSTKTMPEEDSAALEASFREEETLENIFQDTEEQKTEKSEPTKEEKEPAFPIHREEEIDDFLGGVDELSDLEEAQQEGTEETASETESGPKARARVLAVEKWRERRAKADSAAGDQWKAWAVVGALLVLAVIILNSDIFALKSYEVKGNERVSSEAIMNDLGLKEGTNLFRYALSHLNSTPSVDSRLSTVDVYFKWPNRVEVVVEESQTIGYVYFQGTYLCIDRKGQVASTTSVPDEDLPIITGLVIKSFSIGESLNTGDAERYDAVVSIGANLRKYSLETVVNEINVRSLDDIVLKTDRMEIRVGSMTDIEQKISIAASVLEQKGLPVGTLHIESLSDQIYIEPKEIESEIGK